MTHTKYSKSLLSCLVLTSAICMSAALSAQNEYQAPRTEWGQPDLQGVWNFSSSVPMQRPAQYGIRQFLTPEEIEQIQARRAAADANSDSALAIEGVDESYNDFWIENAGIGDLVRTSHIVYPDNGQLPGLVTGAIARQGVYGLSLIHI